MHFSCYLTYLCQSVRRVGLRNYRNIYATIPSFTPKGTDVQSVPFSGVTQVDPLTNFYSKPLEYVLSIFPLHQSDVHATNQMFIWLFVKCFMEAEWNEILSFLFFWFSSANPETLCGNKLMHCNYECFYHLYARMILRRFASVMEPKFIFMPLRN